MKLIQYIKNKLKRKKMKIEVGKTYKVVTTPNGKQSSHGLGASQGQCLDVVVKVTKEHKCGGGGQTQYTCSVITYNGQSYQGQYNYYEYELKPNAINLETIEEDIKGAKDKMVELETEIKDLEEKKQFLITQKIEEFSDEDFKAYQVLKVMGIDDINKAKQITKILGR